MPVMVPLANGVPVAGLDQVFDFVVEKMPGQFRGERRGAGICRRRQFLPPRLPIINHKIRAFRASEP
jgi:hypothetical protein